MGKANIAIPCNTAHYYIDDIQKASEVPVINIGQRSVGEAVERGAEGKSELWQQREIHSDGNIHG